MEEEDFEITLSSSQWEMNLSFWSEAETEWSLESLRRGTRHLSAARPPLHCATRSDRLHAPSARRSKGLRGVKR